MHTFSTYRLPNLNKRGVAVVAVLGTLATVYFAAIWHKEPALKVIQSDLPCGAADYQLGRGDQVLVSVPGDNGTTVMVPGMRFAGRDEVFLCHTSPDAALPARSR